MRYSLTGQERIITGTPRGYDPRIGPKQVTIGTLNLVGSTWATIETSLRRALAAVVRASDMEPAP